MQVPQSNPSRVETRVGLGSGSRCWYECCTSARTWQGIIVKRNVNAHVMRKLGDGSFAKVNFHIYYEIDGEEIKTVLRLWRAGFVLISLEKACSNSKFFSATPNRWWASPSILNLHVGKKPRHGILRLTQPKGRHGILMGEYLNARV